MALHQALDALALWALVALCVLSAFITRPIFGVEHRLSTVVAKAVHWDSDIRWLRGGRYTSLAHQGLFRGHDEKFAWSATQPNHEMGFFSYAALLKRPGGVDGTYVTVVGTAAGIPKDPVEPFGPDRVAPWAWQLRSPYSDNALDVLYWSKGPGNPVCPHFMAVTGLPLAHSANLKHLLVHAVSVRCYDSLSPPVVVSRDAWVKVLAAYGERAEMSPVDLDEVATNYLGGGLRVVPVSNPRDLVFQGNRTYASHQSLLLVIGTVDSTSGFRSDWEANHICPLLLVGRTKQSGDCGVYMGQLAADYTTGDNSDKRDG